MNLGYSVRGVWVCPWGCPFWSTSSHKQRKLGADSIIHCLYWFLSLFSSIWCLPSLPLSPFSKVQYITSPLTVSHPPPLLRSHSLSCSDWQVWWCLSLLSLTFNSQERMHRHTHTARLLMASTFPGSLNGESHSLYTTKETYRLTWQTERSVFMPFKQREMFWPREEGG